MLRQEASECPPAALGEGAPIADRRPHGRFSQHDSPHCPGIGRARPVPAREQTETEGRGLTVCGGALPGDHRRHGGGGAAAEDPRGAAAASRARLRRRQVGGLRPDQAVVSSDAAPGLTLRGLGGRVQPACLWGGAGGMAGRRAAEGGSLRLGDEVLALRAGGAGAGPARQALGADAGPSRLADSP